MVQRVACFGAGALQVEPPQEGVPLRRLLSGLPAIDEMQGATLMQRSHAPRSVMSQLTLRPRPQEGPWHTTPGS